MTPEDIAKYQLELWKEVVGVQQHFNDIEIRIRSLLITILGALAGASGFLFKEGNAAQLPGNIISILASIAVMIVFAFWFMDRHWYHRLLVGAVDQGRVLEDKLSAQIPGADLARQIGDASAFYFLGKKIRSANKIDIFYGIFFFPLLVFILHYYVPGHFVFICATVAVFLALWFVCVVENWKGHWL